MYHIRTFKNCFEAVNLIDQEPQEQGNEINVAKVEYENRLPKMMKQKKSKLDVRINIGNCQVEKTSQSQGRQKSGANLKTERAVSRKKK